MKAVFRHELSSYFTGLTAYIFGAFLLLFGGIYTFVYNINYSLTNFEYVLSGMCFVFIVIVPILTMRVIAEERHQKTDQLLYSLPLSMTGVVIGKYAAMLCVFLVPMVIISCYPLVLSAFGSVYLPAAFGALVGFFFLGAALIAIGTFISSVTENQAVAAGLCFVVMLLNYFIASLSEFASGSAFASFAAFTVLIVVLLAVVWLMTRNSVLAAFTGLIPETVLIVLYTLKSSSFEGLFPQIMENLSLFRRFSTFVGGVFDLTGIVYYLSIIGVFLFLSVQALEKRRWSE